MSSDLDTIPLAPEGGEQGARKGPVRLLVFSPTLALTFPLPESGSVVIGRGAEADVRIDSAALSRRHAELTLGPRPTVKDLGSSNGTRVGGRRLEPEEVCELTPGSALELGDLTLLLQHAPAVAATSASRPRSVWSHAALEARLEEACLRAEAGGSAFRLVRIRGLHAAHAAQVCEAVATALDPLDVLAGYAPQEWHALVWEEQPGRGDEVEADIADELNRRGLSFALGHARFPQEGRTPEALLARAGEGARGETPDAREGDIVVVDPAMQRLHSLVRQVASSPFTVLLLGETGVGKEVFAEAVHRHSPRAQGPFVRLNCAAFSESLLESELFGHDKGAFTGAVKAKPGLLEAANGGTLFLDEVAELPAGVQAKLLRVLEQREVLRLGELRPRPLDVRFVAATHKDLAAEVARGAFRQDLSFRLDGLSLTIPPLRERRAELVHLAHAFLRLAARAMGRTTAPTLSPEAREALLRYAWPGNLRELRNVMERAVVLGAVDVVRPEHLPLEKLLAPRLPPTAAPPPATDASSGQRQRIADALERHGGNQTEAARELGVSRKTLGVWMDAHGIPRPRRGAPPR
ncbi:sigma 54-interacting transcriptional regulator [Pyxidicoccus xibeiensis]|uniref:sigma 54-interacting transcriptional regulator n=1 Tax=Pyxidicoccus xibeiensis TaxID=2906759 RepID=UPI0020A720CA|nr:sigma 54-interacting transcriptional regulator [Pyxidicoccus xibeiensis]MCP3136830.1 sigma 54-interacting transcriptional regulator [Pyxidicoccus xibeiensis]